MRNSWVLSVLLLFALAGCGGGGGSPAVEPAQVAPEETGEVAITVTDAEGDYESYIVDVTSIVLHRADGTTVETLPLTTRIDFAELTEVTEFLTVATVPVGRYHAATLGLDFSGAEILVQDEAGIVHPAVPVDETGTELDQLTVRLNLTDTDSLVIRPGVPAAFSLDFDLDASNTINLTAIPITVSVEPFLLATAELESDRAHRVRGLLDAVDEAAGTVTVDVKPFRHRDGRFGSVSFSADDDTVYEINGEHYSGSEGLTALAALTGGIPLVAGGSVADGGLVAETVLAGSSVPWTDHDVARGVVIARETDQLTLSGVVLEYRDGVVVRRGPITVALSEDTRVSALGLPDDTLNKDSISVGQRIVAFGELADDATLSDTTHVRMQLSNLTGSVVAAEPLAVELHFLSARRPAVYDFTGTGVDPDHDADPAFYQIDTSTLPLGTVESGDLIRARGHVNAWGLAPADFLARTLIDVSLDMRAAAFVAHWPEATANPLLVVDPAGLTLDLMAARSVLKLQGVPLTETNPLESMLLAAPESRRGVYAVRVRGAGEIHLYRNFADLVSEVVAQLDEGQLLKHVGAHGRYNDDDQSLTAGRAVFDFIKPVE